MIKPSPTFSGCASQLLPTIRTSQPRHGSIRNSRSGFKLADGKSVPETTLRRVLARWPGRGWPGMRVQSGQVCHPQASPDPAKKGGDRRHAESEVPILPQGEEHGLKGFEDRHHLDRQGRHCLAAFGKRAAAALDALDEMPRPRPRFTDSFGAAGDPSSCEKSAFPIPTAQSRRGRCRAGAARRSSLALSRSNWARSAASMAPARACATSAPAGSRPG
jgi:hypothetical protein